MKNIGIILSQSHDLYTLCPESDRRRLLRGRASGRLMHGAKRPQDYPAVGDRVEIDWDGTGDSAVIRAVLPRRSCLSRVGDMNTRESQVIAANLDVLAICTSLNQNFSLRRMERYLAAARAAGIEPLLVLTKADLCEDPAGRLAQVRRALPDAEAILSAPDVPDAVLRLRNLLAEGKWIGMAGSSGVGKSTLINAVLGSDRMQTGAIREDDGRGRHTTTHRQLIFAEGGGALIDTPGMRAFALDDADVEETFVQIAALARGCRFSDCTHTREPGCAVQQAVCSGELDRAQLESYIRLSRESSARRREKRLRKP